MNKKLILLPIFTLMVIMMAGMVNAATFNISNGATISGIVNINITTDTLNASADDGLNCTFTGSSAITGDTLVQQQAKNSSLSVGSQRINTTNITLNTAALMTDASDWTFTGNCYNDTDGDSADTETITTVTGIIIDNSNPTCAFNTLTSGSTYKPTQQWSIAGNNATSGNIQFGSNTAKPLTKGGFMSGKTYQGTFTYTGDKKAVPQGSYKTVTVIVSDGTDSTTCGLTSIRIDIGASLVDIVYVATISAQGAKTAATTPPNNNTALIVIFGIAAYGWYRLKKKEGK